MKKLITVFLLVCIMASFCSVSAFADGIIDTQEELVDAIAKGGEVTLGADIDVTPAAGNTYCLQINNGVKINGNGYKISYSGNTYDNRVINIKTSEYVVINDLKVYGNGERGINIIGGNGNVELKNCTVSVANYAVNVSSNGAGSTVTINGGSYYGQNVLNIGGQNVKATVSDAYLETNDGDADEGYATIDINSKAAGSKLTIANSTLAYNHKDADETIGSSIRVSYTGGTIENTVTDNGGNTYKNPPYASRSVAIIDYKNNYWYSFSTLSAAIKKAEAEGGKNAIDLVNNVDLGGQTIEVKENITINANGLTITNGVLKAAEGKNIIINGLAEDIKDTLVSEVVEVDDAAALKEQIKDADKDTLVLTAPVSVTETITVPAGDTVNIELPSNTFTGNELKKDFTGGSLFTLGSDASVKITNVTGTDAELKLMRELVSKDYCVTKGSIDIKDSHGTLSNGVCPDCKVQVKASSVPATADNSAMALWSVLFVVFVGVAVVTKKKCRA